MKKISILMVAFMLCIFGYGPSQIYRNHPNMKAMARQFSYYINQLFHNYDSGQSQQPNQQNVKLHEIIDEATGISIKGELDQYAQLVVKREHVLAKSIDNMDTLICGYRLILSGRYQGELRISFPVGWQYEGQRVIVQAWKGNQVFHTSTMIVKNGQVRVRTYELSSFKIFLNQKRSLSVHGWSLIICISAIILCMIIMNFLIISEGKKEEHNIKKK